MASINHKCEIKKWKNASVVACDVCTKVTPKLGIHIEVQNLSNYIAIKPTIDTDILS